jgi:Glycosyl transferase family 2
MPAYRAEHTLAKTVADIPREIADLLILVDDASPDNTAVLARELGIDVYVHSENRGYGGNQKTCYAEAVRNGADVVVLLHPDYQYEPKAVPLLIAPILAGDADMTFGSRFAGLGDPLGGGMPLYRFVGNRVTTVLENLMLGSRFTETHSGLRAYTRRCLLSLPYLRYSDDFVFDSQLLVDAVTSGQRVVEVPIPTRYTKESSSIAIGRSLRYIGESLGYCARSAAARGRRGRRSPVAHPERALPAVHSAHRRAERTCPLCEREEHVVLGGADGVFLACARCGFVSPRSADGQPSASGKAGATAGRRAAAERILELVGGYLVRGDDLLAVGEDGELVAGLARDAGWQASSARPGELPAPGTQTGATTKRVRSASGLRRGRFDAVVLVDALGPAPVDELRSVRPLLDPDGVLAVAVRQVPVSAVSRRSRPALPPPTGPAFTAAAAWTALGRAGFRLVEWVAPGPGAGAGAVLAARLATRARAAPGAELPLGIAVARLSDRGSTVMPGVVRDSAA